VAVTVAGEHIQGEIHLIWPIVQIEHLFYYLQMAPTSPPTQLQGALARLESRWGSAAVRFGTQGALALAAQPLPEEAVARPISDDVVPTGFARLDALLGTGGLPRGASASFRGPRSCGKTTLALHCLAQAQARGAIAAFLDLCRCFDPLEAVSRGVNLRWLLILRPADPDEGFAIAAALVAGRAIDLLVVDLPDRLPARADASLRRLAARARRADARLIVLEPSNLAAPLHGALAESVGLRLELEQGGWLRAGRDIVGRRLAVNVAKNRFAPPGRGAELEIRYLVDGEHSPALARSA
jgi:RecA/RadA recombinase